MREPQILEICVFAVATTAEGTNKNIINGRII